MNIAWIALAFVCIVLEVGHPGLLYFLSISCGSSAAFLAALLGYSFFVQSLIFFSMTVLCLGLVYFFVKSTMHDIKSHRSNVDLLLGKVVTITEVQSSNFGVGKVGKETWSVKLIDKESLKVGMQATVVEVQGCHLRVQVIKNN